jgi:predicted alpha-1,2-mannosidase
MSEFAGTMRLRVMCVRLGALLACALAALAVTASSASAAGEAVADPADHVNPMIGTTGGGDVFPGASLPFGMIQWSPVTATGNLYSVSGASGTYSYTNTRIRGFSLTHLNGTGCAGLDSDVPILPYAGDITTSPSSDTNDSVYGAPYSHGNETATPGHYSVRFDNGVATDLAVTRRTGSGRFTFPDGTPQNVLLRVSNSGIGSGDPTNVAIDPGTRTVSGEVTGGGFCGANGVTANNRDYYHLFFVAQFDRDFASYGTWKDGALDPGSKTASGGEGYTRSDRTGKGSGAWVGFDPKSNRTVGMRVGISYVSEDNARANLAAENPPDRSFASVAGAAHRAWTRELSHIAVTPGPNTTDDQVTVFYTALYHALLQPTLASDVNGQYEGADDQHGNPGGTRTIDHAHQSAEYDTFSGWDQYRGQVQLLTLVDPQVGNDFAQSLLNLAGQRGEWDRWLDRSAKTSIMEGDASAPAISGIHAFLDGVHGLASAGFDLRAAEQSLLKAATVPTANDTADSADPAIGAGCAIGCPGQRPALPDYLKLHFVPAQNCHCWGAAGETLEDANADFSVAQLARAVGDTDTYDEFLDRSEYWQNVFNPEFTSGDFSGYAWNHNAPRQCMTGSVLSHVAEVSATGENPPDEVAANLDDCDVATKWLQFAQPSESSPLSVTYRLDSPQVVRRYALSAANDSPGRDPAAWQLQGSQDGSSWTTLDSRTGQSFASRFATNTYDVANDTAYAYYRLLFTANAGDPLTQLSEWEISDGSSTQPPPIPGGFASGFSPTSGRGFAEGSTTQYSWMVYHDVAKLVSLMGGQDKVVPRLDAFFSSFFDRTGPSSTRFDPTNEPDIQTPWMYDYLGVPSKTQATVRRLVNQLWTNTTGGVTGNDDLGTMSAWNVWASLGMWPYVPGRSELVLASPLFPHVVVDSGNGRRITIDAPGADSGTPYVSGLRVNGASSDRPWLPATFVRDGGSLQYDLGDAATGWGSDPADAPPSLSDNGSR